MCSKPRHSWWKLYVSEDMAKKPWSFPRLCRPHVVEECIRVNLRSFIPKTAGSGIPGMFVEHVLVLSTNTSSIFGAQIDKLLRLLSELWEIGLGGNCTLFIMQMWWEFMTVLPLWFVMVVAVMVLCGMRNHSHWLHGMRGIHAGTWTS